MTDHNPDYNPDHNPGPAPGPIPDIDALAAALGIPLQPEFRDGVAANLAVSLRLATLVAAFPLDDAVDLAPTYRA